MMTTDIDRDVVAVGVDDSYASGTAAEYAAAEATARGLGLLVVHAYGQPETFPSRTEWESARIRERALQVVEASIAQLGLPEAAVGTLIECGETATVLRRAADRARVLVLGHDRTERVEHLLTGSVTSALSRTASCPVVAVPPQWTSSAGAVGPVVVPLDGESAAEGALRYGFERADLLGARLVALHAMPRTRADRAERAEHEANLSEVLAGWRAEFPDVVVETEQVLGKPREVVAQASDGAAAVVVGRPSREGFGSWTLSVTRSVLNRSRCPLVVIPQDAGELRRPEPSPHPSEMVIPTY